MSSVFENESLAARGSRGGELLFRPMILRQRFVERGEDLILCGRGEFKAQVVSRDFVCGFDQLLATDLLLLIIEGEFGDRR